MAYLRLLTVWPANANMMLHSMHNAITLDNVTNSLYNSFFRNFVNDFNNEDDEQARLEENDIMHKNLGLSLGIFFIFLSLLILAVFLYFITEIMADRVKFCKKVRNILKAKLFYNAWIRYMIESNLKMTHNCIFFLYVSGSFLHTEDKINTITRIFLLIIIVLWPIFTTIWLLCNREKIDEKGFKWKFISMYQGVKTNHVSSLLYTTLFCTRRLTLVCSLIAL